MAGTARLTTGVLAALSAMLAHLILAPPVMNGTDHAVLIAAGNIGDCTSDGDEATAALVEELSGTVAALGDLAYPNGAAHEFTECYDPTWGRFRDRTRPVPGNHDYGTAAGAPYFGYFAHRAGDPNRGYYSYQLAGWHIVALNSVCEEVSCTDGSEQMSWLREDLRSRASSCVLAYWHHPRFSSGGIGSDARMEAAWRILQDAGADIILTAHSQHYERFALQDHRGTLDPDGIRQFVVGTGGTHLYPVGTRLLNSQAVVEHHGVLRLDLRDDGYSWEFLGAAEQSPTDTGTGLCGDRPVQVTAVVRALAPALVLVPLLTIGVAILVLRGKHFRIH